MHVRGHSGDTQYALRCAVLVVCLCQKEGRKEGGREGRKEGRSARGVVHSCASSVLSCVAHFFQRKGITACHGNAATKQPFPSLRAWHVESPGADQLLGANTKGSRVPLSPLVSFSAALLSVVSDTRVQTAWELKMPPHSHVAMVSSLPHYRDCLSSLTLGGAAAVYQCQGFLFARYFRESQGSSRCRCSPASDLKAGAAGLKHLPTTLTGAAGLKNPPTRFYSRCNKSLV